MQQRSTDDSALKTVSKTLEEEISVKSVKLSLCKLYQNSIRTWRLAKDFLCTNRISISTTSTWWNVAELSIIKYCVTNWKNNSPCESVAEKIMSLVSSGLGKMNKIYCYSAFVLGATAKISVWTLVCQISKGFKSFRKLFWILLKHLNFRNLIHYFEKIFVGLG